MNLFVISGRLTRPVELKQSNGGFYGRISIFVDKGLSKSKKEEYQKAGKATADFLTVTVFDKVAENCEKFLDKGSSVLIQGRITFNTYTNQNNEKGYRTDLIANSVEFLDSPKSNKGQDTGSDQSSKPADNSNFDDFDDTDIFNPVDIDDDDIPF